jgi:hypothetical protein
VGQIRACVAGRLLAGSVALSLLTWGEVPFFEFEKFKPVPPMKTGRYRLREPRHGEARYPAGKEIGSNLLRSSALLESIKLTAHDFLSAFYCFVFAVTYLAALYQSRIVTQGDLDTVDYVPHRVYVKPLPNLIFGRW